MERIRYHGGFADVSNGEYLERPVAVKRLKVYEGDHKSIFKVPFINLIRCLYHCSTSTQWLCREIIGWKHLSNPNILPLLGVSVSADPHCFLILTDWMSNGNVVEFTRSHPEENRLRLVSPFTVPLQFSSHLITFSSLGLYLV